MFAGGQPMTVADRDRIRALDGEREALKGERGGMRDEMSAAQEEHTAARETQENAGLATANARNELEDAAEGYAHKKDDFEQARSDRNAEKSEVRGRKQALEGAEDGVKGNENKLASFVREQIDPIRSQIKQTRDFLQIQFWDWARKLSNEEELAKLQAIYKTQLDMGKIIVSAFAAFSNMNAALLGVPKTGGSALFEATPLNPVARVEADWVETKARLEGQEENLRDTEARYAQMRADPYYRAELAEKRREESEAVAALNTEEQKMNTAETSKDGARETRDAARAGYRSKQEAEQAAAGPVREYERKMREIQNRMTANEEEDQERQREQYGIRDSASIP